MSFKSPSCALSCPQRSWVSPGRGEGGRGGVVVVVVVVGGGVVFTRRRQDMLVLGFRFDPIKLSLINVGV